MPLVERTPLSESDAANIWLFIARDNEVAADALIDKIERRLESLSRMPLSAEEVPFIKPGVHRSSIGNYVIYYRPIRDGIQVLRILHGARLPEDLI